MEREVAHDKEPSITSILHGLPETKDFVEIETSGFGLVRRISRGEYRDK